jgi:thioredoxin domain-containing protein 5
LLDIDSFAVPMPRIQQRPSLKARIANIMDRLLVTSVLACIFALATIEPSHGVVSVIPLRYDNFESLTQIQNITKSKNDWFIMFYAPWCKHCKQLDPIFDKLSARYFQTGLSFAKVNINKEPRLAERFGVKSVPQLIIISKGKMYIYTKQSRNLENIRAWADGEYELGKHHSVPLDFTVVQVVWKMIWNDTILVLRSMYLRAPLPTLLNLGIGMCIGAASMFLIMKGAWVAQLNDIAFEKEVRREKRRLRREKHQLVLPNITTPQNFGGSDKTNKNKVD